MLKVKYTVPRHGSDILHRPDDVIGTKCGETVELSCVARSTSIKTVVSDYFLVEY